MAKLVLEVETNGLEAFHKATQNMDQLNNGVSKFEKEGKASFIAVSKETDNLTQKIKASATESIDSSNKITQGKNKEAAAIKLLKDQIDDVTAHEKKLQELINSTAPGKVQADYRKKLAETRFDLQGMQKDLIKMQEEEKALTPPVVSLRKQLTDLKQQITKTTDPADYQRLVEKAGELESKISDTSAAVNAFASTSKAAQASNLFSQISSDISNLDFANAAEKSKQFAAVIKTISFKEVVGGIKDFGTALINIGKAILYNPFTVLLISLVAVGLALKGVYDSMDAGLQALEDNRKALMGVSEATDEITRATRDLALEKKIATEQITNTDGELLKSFNKYNDGYLKVLDEQKKATKDFNDAIQAEREDDGFKATKLLFEKLGFETDLTRRQKIGLKEIQEQYNKEIAERTKFYEEEKSKIIAESEFAASKKRKEEADKKKKEQEQYAKDLAAALLDISKRAQQAELAGLNGKEKLDKQKEITDQEIQLLRETLIKKQVLAGQGNKLSAEVEAEFQKISLQNARAYSDGLVAIAVENANLLAQQEEKKTKNSLDAFNLRQQTLIDAANAAQKPNGVDDTTFELQKQKSVLAIQKNGITERLQLEIDEIQESANVKITAAEQELKLLKDKTDETSNIKRIGLQADIDMIKASTPEEIAAIKAKLDAELTSINKQLIDANKKMPKTPIINWAVILGVSQEDLPKIEAQINQVISMSKDLISSQFAFQKQQLDQEMSMIDQRISARNNDINDLQSKLTDENNLRKDGLANNVDTIKKEIDAKIEANKKDLDEQKKIQERKRALAKQQLIIDTVLQASQMASAIAKTINTYAAVPPVAIALAAAEVAAFIASKAVAFKAASQSSNFAKGVIDLKGPGTKTSDSIPSNLSKGESVMTADETQENINLFYGIRKKDNRLIEIGIRDLIKNTGVTLSKDMPRELSQMKSQARIHEINVMLPKKDASSERRMESIENHIKKIVGQGAENKYLNEAGNLVIEKGNLTRIIKKK